MPVEATEGYICERFGWTFSQLDEEDIDRVYTSTSLMNIRGALDRIRAWLDSVGKIGISKQDLETYKMVLDAEREIDK